MEVAQRYILFTVFTQLKLFVMLTMLTMSSVYIYCYMFRALS